MVGNERSARESGLPSSPLQFPPGYGGTDATCRCMHRWHAGIAETERVRDSNGKRLHCKAKAGWTNFIWNMVDGNYRERH